MSPLPSKKSSDYREAIDQMERFYRQPGETLASVGKKFGLATRTVRQLFAREGIKLKKPGEAKSERLRTELSAIVEEMKRLYRQPGGTMASAGKRFGLSPSAVHRHFIREGIKIKKNGEAKSERTPNLDTEIIIEMARVYRRRGETVASVAKKFGLLPRDVRLHFNRAGIKAAAVKRQAFETVLSDAMVEMERLYRQEGLSYVEIGKQFGISHEAVRQEFIKAGIKSRKQGSKRHHKLTPVAAKIVRLYVEQLVPVVQLAKKFNCSEAAIRSLLKREGIKLHGNRKPPKYPMLKTLQIGESFQVLKPTCKGTWQSVFYEAAAEVGIRVSVSGKHETLATIKRVA